jgi:ELWxxDGT repeat protein
MVTNVIEGGLGDGEIGGDDNPATSSLSSTLVKDIFKGNKDSSPSKLFQYKGDLFFAAENNKQGNELWKSEGSKSTTSLLKDINQGKASSMPYGFTLFDNEIYFSANDGNDGVELWSSDGTSRGTKQVSDLNPGPGSSSPSDLVALDNKLIFSANDGDEGSEGEELPGPGFRSETCFVPRLVPSLLQSSTPSLPSFAEK